MFSGGLIFRYQKIIFTLQAISETTDKDEERGALDRYLLYVIA
jgi:hypothetical protein